MKDSLEGATHPIIIRIPGLGDSGVGLPQLSDEGEDPQTIRHRHRWISLGRLLLSEEEVTRLVSCPDQQCGPVAVSVECKPRATGTLMERQPQHGCAVLLIERIALFNEEEPPVLLNLNVCCILPNHNKS